MSTFKPNDIPELAAKALGYSSYSEFNKGTDLYIRVSRDTGAYVDVLINNDTDFFARSYSRESSCSLGWKNRDVDLFSSSDNLLLLKTRVKSKIKQQNAIFLIKREAIMNIIKYVTDVFEIEPSAMEVKDIVFSNYNSFEIADNTFYFTSMLSGNTFKINEARYTTHKEAFSLVTSIKKYFEEKKRNE